MIPSVVVLADAVRDEFYFVPPGYGLAVVHPDGSVAHLRKEPDGMWLRETAQ